MSQVLVTEQHLSDIAGAIRAKLGAPDSYRPGEMAAAIREIETYPEPAGSVSIAANGTHDVKDYASAVVNVPNSYAASDEGKVVSSGALVAQTSRTVTANGTYDTTENDEVVVDVQSGGGTSYLPDLIADGYFNNEFKGYVYGRTAMIDAGHLVLLGDFSQTGAASGNVLSDSIENYSMLILQGIYRGQRQSGYNTSMLYKPALNKSFWAGMQDRNKDYTCNVTFTDDTHCSLTGNRQCIIYGVP